MKSRKGFTLVELIGVVILIGLIALIAIPSVDYIINKTKDNAYEATVKTLMTGLHNWVTDNKELVYEDGTEILLTLTDLKEQGYVDFDIRNPKTKLCLANNMQFKITRVKSEEKDKYEFEIMGNELLDGTLRDCEAVSKTPSIYLLGDNPQKIEITNDIALGYETYDPGVVAKSTTGEDLTHSVVKTNDVKLNILSKNYHAKYTIIENGISKTVTRKVHVVDTTEPELHVPEDLEIELGETLNLLEGVTATDNSGETPKIKTSGNVNFNKEGEYKVTYIATDSSGNSVSKDRVIKVLRPYYVLKSYSGVGVSSRYNTEFHDANYATKIITMSFVNDIKIPENVVVQWDLSESGDGSIIGWLVEIDDNPGYYNLYIGSYGHINANPVMQYWFRGLTSLMKINFDNFNTIGVDNMFGMFYDCQSLVSLDLSTFDTSLVDDMGRMFYNCKALTEVELRNFDTSNVTNMSYMFEENNSLNVLDLSSFDTSNVTDMSSMFKNTKTTSINLSSFNTSKVTNMSSMFRGTKAATLNLLSFDTSNVTNMYGMFASVRPEDRILDLSNFKTSSLKSMTQMFQYSNIDEIKGLNKFDTSQVTSLEYTFADCQAKQLDLSSFDTSKVTNMRHTFSYAHASSLDMSSFDTSSVTDMTSMFLCAYSDQSLCKLKELSGFDNWDTSNVTTMMQMFWGVKVSVLDLNGFDTENVKDMSWMFRDCSAENINVSSFNTTSVTNMSYMFYNAKQLSSIDLSSFNTSNVTTMESMFSKASSLKNIYIGPEWVTAANTSSMFYSCGTKTLTLKES